MEAVAVILQEPERLTLSRLELSAPGEDDVVVDVAFSGISTGTERLLYTGRMPSFPGMGYPLVPGYESVGRVVCAGPRAGIGVGETVFVPGARCFGEVRGLFGGAASRLVVGGSRVVRLDPSLGENGILLALAATALHAIGDKPPQGRSLVVGHGVLGRLLARLLVLLAAEPPVVWERDASRANGAVGYAVHAPDEDPNPAYSTIYDVSGDSQILDRLIARMTPGGEIVLAGFYEASLSFAFPPAFMREARIRVAAQWRENDLATVTDLIHAGRLSLDGLITHREDAGTAESAYRTAFGDPSCLKMILDWRACS
jgi:3-hydroxyethyl bacteriochlorophyllide a dehydrogenase